MATEHNSQKKNVELNKDNVDWFYSTFYGGSLTALLDELLSEFRALYDRPPKEYSTLAAKSMKEKLDG